MKDPDERIAVISPNGNQFDYFTRKLATVSRCKIPLDCYTHVNVNNPDRLRGVTWSKVILLNNPRIDNRAERILDYLKGKGIQIVNINERDIQFV